MHIISSVLRALPLTITSQAVTGLRLRAPRRLLTMANCTHGYSHSALHIAVSMSTKPIGIPHNAVHIAGPSPRTPRVQARVDSDLYLGTTGPYSADLACTRQTHPPHTTRRGTTAWQCTAAQCPSMLHRTAPHCTASHGPAEHGPTAQVRLEKLHESDSVIVKDRGSGRGKGKFMAWSDRAWQSIRANMCLRRGKWYYEARVHGTSIIHVGWCTKKFRHNERTGIGDCAHSWAYDGVRVGKWHRGQRQVCNSVYPPPAGRPGMPLRARG